MGKIIERERERKNIRRNHLVLEGRGRGHIRWKGLLRRVTSG